AEPVSADDLGRHHGGADGDHDPHAPFVSLVRLPEEHVPMAVMVDRMGMHGRVPSRSFQLNANEGPTAFDQYLGIHRFSGPRPGIPALPDRGEARPATGLRTPLVRG